MKYVIIGLGAFLFWGCSLQTTMPPVTEYRLKPVSIEKRPQYEACIQQTLQVSVTLGPDLFMSRQIHYADAEFRQYTYTRSRWVEGPERQLRHLLESAMAQSGLYKSVVTYNSQVYNDLYFEPKINNFMQYFEDNGTSYVHVDMELVVMDQRSARAISTLHIDEKLVTESADAIGAVKAFNTIVQQSLQKTIGWLEDVCQQESLPEQTAKQ